MDVFRGVVVCSCGRKLRRSSMRSHIARFPGHHEIDRRYFNRKVTKSD